MTLVTRSRHARPAGVMWFALPYVGLLLLASAASAQGQRRGAAAADSTPPARVVLSDTVRVPIELERGFPMVTVRVNGRGPYRFGIETGGRLIAVSPALAESLALPPVGADSSTFGVDSISIGAVRFEGLHVTPVRTSQPGVDGLLGLPAFEELLLTIDYPAKQLVLTRGGLPAPDGEDVLAASRVGPFWGVPLTIGGRAVNSIIDTRSGGAIGFTPGDTAKVRWTGPLAVIGQARGAEVPLTAVLGGRLADDVTLGRHVFKAPFVSVRALPADFPQNPIIGSRLLQNFVFTLDQRNGRARFTRESTEPIVLPEPRRPGAPGGPGGLGAPGAPVPAPGDSSRGK